MRKKVGILTFQWADNYGGLLQCYALKEYLKKMDCDPTVVNYWPRFALIKRGNRLGSASVRKQFGVNVKAGKKQVLKSILLGRRRTSREITAKMDRFREQNLVGNQKPYLSRDDILKDVNQFDLLISGSDQIWNPNLTGGRFDPCYFLNFPYSRPQRAAYAASLGVSLKPEWEKEFGTNLSRYQHISTRESSLAETIREKYSLESYAVVDPVLLLEQADWDKLIPAPKGKGGYILLYVLQRNNDIVAAANWLTKETGLPVRVIGARRKYNNAQYLTGCSIEEFLMYFRDADYVLTNSFHGTAFSVIFKKRFLTFLDTNKPARMVDLLTGIGLEGRIFRGDNQTEILNAPDYDSAGPRLKERIEASEKYLAECVSSEGGSAMPVSIQSNALCTGCGSCSIVCPKQAISMQRNGKGFLQAVVDESACVNCGLCVKACHLVNGHSYFGEPLQVLAAKNTSREDRAQSSSGGIFLLLARQTLDAGGVVYGAAFDDDNTVRHIRAESMEEVRRCCQSKYVQSDVVDAVGQAIEDARSGRPVLFTGTPCQVAALRSVMDARHMDGNNVLLADIVCHGTPSPAVFRDYLAMIGEKYGGEVERFYFRDKAQGWRGYNYKAVFRGGRTVINGFYLRGFNKLFTLTSNEACFQCPYSRPERVSDITLGDFWGIEKARFSGFEDNLGVSMLIVNTKKGKARLEMLAEYVESVQADIDDCRKNIPLFSSLPRPKNCDTFWDMYREKGYGPTFDRFCRFTGKNGLKERVKWVLMYKLKLKGIILRVHSILAK